MITANVVNLQEAYNVDHTWGLNELHLFCRRSVQVDKSSGLHKMANMLYIIWMHGAFMDHERVLHGQNEMLLQSFQQSMPWLLLLEDTSSVIKGPETTVCVA